VKEKTKPRREKLFEAGTRTHGTKERSRQDGKEIKVETPPKEAERLNGGDADC